MPRRYLLVGNPTARSGKGLAHLDAILRTMRDLGQDITLLKTEPEGRTPGVVARAVDQGDWDVVIYAGGDGTFAEVAKGLMRAGRRVPMGMMPGGTANDQGQSFGLESGVDAVPDNVRVLLAGHTIALDAGRITRVDLDGRDLEQDHWFDNMGFGFAASVLATRNRDREVVGQIPLLRELYRNQAVYVGAMLQEALRSFVEPTRFDAEVVVDDHPPHRVTNLTDVVFNNTPVFGGEWIPVKQARANDGWLDAVAMEGQSRLLTALILDHKHVLSWDLPDVPLLTWRGRSFDITLLAPHGGDVPCQIDGEEWHAGSRFRVEVVPGALDLIVPAGFEPPWK